MKTKEAVTLKFRDYGEITVPKGTRLTHQTACGVDKSYHFVADFGWIKEFYPTIDRVLQHDAVYYGINIPKEFVDYEKRN